MGTRGIFGFRVNGKDYLTYNHHDSYPSWLGQNCLNAVKEIVNNRNLDEIREKISNIQLVGSDDEVPSELQERYKDFTDLDVGGLRSMISWYQVLRKAQGHPLLWLDSIDHMRDSSNFVFDSLFCEYGYIINLDTECLEVYEGFQERHHEKGRYSRPEPDEGGYYPIALVSEISFSDCLGRENLAGVIEDE